MKSTPDSLGRSLSVGLALVALLVVAVLSSFCQEGSGPRHACGASVALRDMTPAIHGQSPPAGTPSTPAPSPASGVADAPEDEVEGGDPSGLRFSTAWRPAKRVCEGASGPALGCRDSVSALVARAADYGRLCRRLL